MVHSLLTIILQILCLITVSVNAIPTNTSTTMDLAMDPIKIINSHDLDWATVCLSANVRSRPRIMAVERAVQLIDAGETVGVRKYPHRFLNRDERGDALFNWVTDVCNVANTYYMWEFPTLINKEVYDGDDPEEYRVVFKSDHVNGQWEIHYCGTIAHSSGKGVRGGFVGCDVKYLDVPERTEAVSL